MTSAEWLTSHFGSEDEFCPMIGYTADRNFFLSVFGPSLEEAINTGTSTYQALMNVDGGTRGWELYFDDWKRRGILT